MWGVMSFVLVGLVELRSGFGSRLCEKGGDWDRRNRLKVYQGTYYLATRQFAKAAKLFLDSVATFTCDEMYSYNKFVFYLVVVALIALDRPMLRNQVMKLSACFMNSSTDATALCPGG